MKKRTSNLCNSISSNLLLISVVSSCGTISLPPHASEQAAFIEVSATVPFDNPGEEIVSILEPAAEQPVVKEVPPVDVVQTLSIAEHSQQAFSYLEKGDYASAQRHIDEVLQFDPENTIALTMKEVLEVDPRQLLGEKYFDYTVEPGDSISQLTGRFLQQPLHFVALARFNNLPNPSELRVGRVLKIPEQPGQKDQAEVAEENPRDAQAVEDAYRIYRQALSAQRQQKVEQAIALWDQFLERVPDDKNAIMYRQRAQELRSHLMQLVAH